MNHNPFLKIAAVASSVLLLSAFVAYRAGAFDSLLGNKPSELHENSGQQPSDSDGTSIPHMVGIKSDVGLIQIPSMSVPPESTGPVPEPKVLMSGSKSSYVVTPNLDLLLLDAVFPSTQKTDPTNVLSTPPAQPLTPSQPDAKPGSSGVDGKKQPAIFWGSKWSPAFQW